MTPLAKTLTLNNNLNNLFHGAQQFFWQGKKLSLNQRSVRLAVGLVEPVLSVTDLLNRPWEIGFELLSIFLIVTSLTGVCIAGKIWKIIRSVGKGKRNRYTSLNESAKA
jgi:hypothetical protein